MRVRRLAEAVVQERGDLRSHILMDAGELGSRNLCVTWCVVEAGGSQRPHSHPECEQVYVVVEGSAKVSVTGEEEFLGKGDMVLIPPGSEHSLTNAGESRLVYVTATAPPVSMDELYRTQLAPELDDYLDGE